jgi:hypothetical protein
MERQVDLRGRAGGEEHGAVLQPENRATVKPS